jgi:hypothetical protein
MITKVSNATFFEHTGKVLNKIIRFDHCDDIYGFFITEYTKIHLEFPNTTDIFYVNCDKNFVYFNANPDIFPKVKNIYLLSHPCEHSLFHRFPKEVNYYLIDKYKRFSNHTNLTLCNETELRNKLEKYKEEKLIFKRD